jgi:LmbE family N-acetylglucosaminyl deacetylase
MLQKILILSPHLDDAVLSCCDFALSFQARGFDIEVVTLFDSFSNKYHSKSHLTNRLPEYSKRYLNESGFSSVSEFAKARRNEDKKALSYLNFDASYAGYIDGGFRSQGGIFLYPDKQSLFSGKIAPEDVAISDHLISLFKKKFAANQYRYVLCPFGIGKHADHLITKLVAQKVFPPEKVLYYYEWPYSFSLTIGQIFYALRHMYSFKLISSKKKQALFHYTSQIGLLFGKYKPMQYPEVIVW